MSTAVIFDELDTLGPQASRLALHGDGDHVVVELDGDSMYLGAEGAHDYRISAVLSFDAACRLRAALDRFLPQAAYASLREECRDDRCERNGGTHPHPGHES